MTTEIISVAEIKNGLLEGIKAYITIESLPLPRTFQPVVEAFWEAARKIHPALRIPKRVVVVFATTPFRLTLSNGELSFALSAGVVNACVEDMIFLDCNQIRSYDFSVQVASILEELVHVLMNIGDEVLVKRVVANLYDGIEYVNDQYRPRT